MAPTRCKCHRGQPSTHALGHKQLHSYAHALGLISNCLPVCVHVQVHRAQCTHKCTLHIIIQATYYRPLLSGLNQALSLPPTRKSKEVCVRLCKQRVQSW